MQTPARLVAAAVLSLAALSVSACGDSGDEDAKDSPTTETTTEATSEAASDAPATLPECKAEDIAVEGDFGAEPTITIPDDCSPPTTLIAKDLVAGSGPGAEAGATVLANYHLVTWSDKAVLDSSFARGEPYPVENLGQAQVIQGWNEGLIGIEKGARRLLVVPPDLGYGAGGNGVAPNETLVFVIDAVDVS
ncbi:MAG: FKBP-type peptidyl-prolyl cis-trans isomerase [Propionibacteriales bacterium]|nr:FKBP-type peptidyl-prolyl cis-trans isomerase [Propionibacteriales bacterium]